MAEVYFENLPEIGDLYLEKVFNKFEDENIIFLCRNFVGRYYICLCYEFRITLKWIIVGVSVSDVIKLVINRISIRDIFAKNDFDPFLIEYDGDDCKVSRKELDKIDKNILPGENIYLRLEDIQVKHYIYYLYLKLLDAKHFSYQKSMSYKVENKKEISNSIGCTKRHLFTGYNMDVEKEKQNQKSTINIFEAA